MNNRIIPLKTDSVRSRLIQWNNDIALYDGLQSIGIISEIVVPEQSNIFKIEAESWSLFNNQLIISDKVGNVWQWSKNAVPEKICAAGDGTLLRVQKINDSEILVWKKNGEQKNISRINFSTSSIIWSINTDTHNSYVTDNILFQLSGKKSDHLEAVNLDTGNLIWKKEKAVSQFLSFVGIQNNVLWITCIGGIINGINILTGNEVLTINIPNIYYPSGLLDSKGYFHICNGLSYQCIDLNNSGNTIKLIDLQNKYPGSSTAIGSGMIMLNEKLFLYRNSQNKVLILNIMDESIFDIYTAGSIINGLAVSNESVYILESAQKLVVVDSLASMT